ncbi:TrmB family transcriptional regulator [Nitrososphaera sp. AFS]|jgi:sugar-specific transcriptional regulator TrmB|uniref:TrmB family transcriptional regulator n=1 Tax=Nitrososphaera sp. AFS TaxID=2301191 RepID=UPI0013923075|nr:helix-turn-helix domain-containing protein [Nitrososphaera sp. AFS]NAL77689.1 TrmB family transcriptional regulator [Nitrososphaera sp. AFS]
MNISDKSRKAMESLGLTGYEIKVYLALVESGKSTASEISKKSGVPYSKIYEVLNGLEDKGWSESDSSRPQKFFPRPPSSALEAMRMRIESGIKDNENLIIGELMPVYEKSGLRERPEIWVVRGMYNIAAKVNEIVQTCQQELLIALPQVVEDIARPVQPMLRILHDKGVKITVLVSEQTSPDTVRTISRIADVRLKNNMFGGGVIGDSRQVMILLGEGKSEVGKFEPIAIWAEHIGLAGFAKDYFHYLWADAASRDPNTTKN